MSKVHETGRFHLSASLECQGMEPQFLLETQDLHDCNRHEDERGTLLRWGTPMLDGRILAARELLELFNAGSATQLAGRLDGGFIILHYDSGRHRLRLINDRLGSLPLFYLKQAARFACSSSFKRLFDARGAVASPGLDPWTVLEFLWFRRVFGERTYDQSIRFLPGASILTVDAGGEPVLERYWRPQPRHDGEGAEVLSERLAAAIRQSVGGLMSDQRHYGLMLSGGLDARAILAAAPYSPICFTTAPRPNNEVAVAAELAALRGAEHHFLVRPERLLNERVDDSIHLGGGMTVYSEAQFIGYGEAIGERADTFLLGLALDIMFCGHYLPKSLVRIGGRALWNFHLDPMPADLSGHFLDHVSYRLKTTSPLRVVRAELHGELRERLRANIEVELEEGRGLGFRGYDLWEYLHLHNLARHYSLQMAQSIRSFGACRVPAVNNALYDLCWTLTAEDKANWQVYQQAIVRLDPALMRVRNANTNIRADRPLWQQSAIKVLRAGLRRIPGMTGAATPSWWDRSWPHPRQSIEANPLIREWVRRLPGSECLQALEVFDPVAIAELVREHQTGTQDHTVILNLLLTIDRALRPAGG